MFTCRFFSEGHIASPNTIVKERCGKGAGGWDCKLNAPNGAYGWSLGKCWILTLILAWNAFKIDQIQVWQLALMPTSQQACVNHNFMLSFKRLSTSCFLYTMGNFYSSFEHFKSCWNASDSAKFILKWITDLYLFDSWNFLGTFFGCLNQYTSPQNALTTTLTASTSVTQSSLEGSQVTDQ